MSFLRLPVLRHGLLVRDQAILPDGVICERIEKVRGMMAANGVTCLIAYSDPTRSGPVCYLTNYPCFGMGRRATVLLGREEGPFLFTAEPSRNLPRVRLMTTCDIENTRQFLSAACERAGKLAGKGNIGLAGFDNLPTGLVKDTKALDGLPVRNLSQEYTLLTAAKDEGALRAARQAAVLAEKGLRQLGEEASSGQNLWELAAAADYRLRLDGCEDTNILLNASSAGRLRPAYPSHLRPQPGDALIAYVAVQYARHWGVAATTFAVGVGEKRLNDRLEALRTLQEKTVPILAASATRGEAEARIREIGKGMGIALSDDIPLLSGIGYDLHEYPVNADDRLEKGMTVQVALAADFDEGPSVMGIHMMLTGDGGSVRFTGTEKDQK